MNKRFLQRSFFRLLNMYQKKFKLRKILKEKSLELKNFKALQYIIIHILNLNSGNMFCSVHNFISLNPSFNLCHCYLKCTRF